MKIAFFHRKPKFNNFSVEGTFRVVREMLPPNVECVVAQSRFDSSGLFRRLYNIVEAFFRQGDVNHITGDVHFLSYMLARDKTLLTILDCVAMYNTSGLKRSLIRILWYVIPEKRVKLISVISESTKNELVKFISCDPNKIRVIPVCISPGYFKTPKDFNSAKPRILQVGTAKNKNLERLIEALEGVPCTLHIVGKLSSQQLSVLREKKIEYSSSSKLPESELIEKYKECDLVTFVSTYEGFGMPIIEANAIGRPVITSNLLSMPEVSGNAACIVDPYNISGIRAGLSKIINNQIYRETLIENGYENAKRFHPEKIAEQYRAIYSELFFGELKD